jgi:hypothetical protein
MARDRITRLSRTSLILLLVCLTLAGQSLALNHEQETHHAQDHCCLLCHVGPLPFLQTTVAASIAPIFLVIWLAPALHTQRHPHLMLSAISSRGPPVR